MTLGRLHDLLQQPLGRNVLHENLELGIAGLGHAQLLRHLPHQREYPGELVLREQVDLEVQIRTPLGGRRHAILRNQDERGEKDESGPPIRGDRQRGTTHSPSMKIGFSSCIVALVAACSRAEPPLRVGATHTLEQSGALAVLDSSWSGARLSVIVGPSGQMLRAGANGDLDIVITHAPTLERRLLVEPGGAALRCPLFASRFAIVGPAADPARVRSAPTAADAFRRIVASGAPFVSRGDSSGTHVRELALWRAAGVDPGAVSRRIESGADQATTLRLAEARDAYALADLPTLLRQRDVILALLFETDTMLVNPYTLYVVRKPRPHPAAAVFVRWAVRTWRPALAALRLPDGSPAFEPAVTACSAPLDSVMP